ncbi:MAG: hypothetical protein ACM3PF_02075, partial [Bacteroidota bacterium]
MDLQVQANIDFGGREEQGSHRAGLPQVIVDKQRLARLPALLLLSLGAMSCRKAGNPVKPKQDTTAPV